MRRTADVTTLLDRRELTFEYSEEAMPFAPPARSSNESAVSSLFDAELCIRHGFPREAIEHCEDVFARVAEGRIEDQPTDRSSTLHEMLKVDRRRPAIV